MAAVCLHSCPPAIKLWWSGPRLQWKKKYKWNNLCTTIFLFICWIKVLACNDSANLAGCSANSIISFVHYVIVQMIDQAELWDVYDCCAPASHFAGAMGVALWPVTDRCYGSCRLLVLFDPRAARFGLGYTKLHSLRWIWKSFPPAIAWCENQHHHRGCGG